jgi:hypothetical protein
MKKKSSLTFNYSIWELSKQATCAILYIFKLGKMEQRKSREITREGRGGGRE